MKTTDITKTLTSRQLVLAGLKRSLVEGATHARQKRAEGQRLLTASRAARAAGDVATAEKLLVQCFEARGEADDKADARRHALLVYGFLRGRCYRAIEPRCAEGNEPSARAVQRILAERFTQAGDRGPVASEAEIARWVDALTPAEQAQEAA